MNFDDIKLSTMQPGTYTIKAIFDGDDTYNPKTVEFILVVGERPEETHIIINLDEDEERQYITFSFDEPVVTIIEDLTTNKYALQLPNNPKNVQYTWKCLNNDNVSFDLTTNTIVIPNIGEYQLMAVFAGNAQYYPASDTYMLRLTDDEGNVVRTQRHYNFYLEEYSNTVYEKDDKTYTLPVVKSKREEIIPEDILSLCTWTIDGNTIPYTDFATIHLENIGTYTATFSFAGNSDWLPQTLEYTITIREKENPELSFENEYLVLPKNSEGKYVMQALNNPHGLHPIVWMVTTTQKDMIRLDPSQMICYVDRVGQFPIIARFEGNDMYKAQQVVYNLRIISSQEEATISFEYPYLEYESYAPLTDAGERYMLQRLINPCGLPVTWTIDTLSANIDIDNNQVVFFHTVRNAVITASFAGDEYYQPMQAQYTITYINWEERIQPTIEFPEAIQTFFVELDQDYDLQHPVLSHNIPLEWSITHSDHARVDAEHWKVYIEEFDFYTITASFTGDDTYKPASASYEIHLTREEARIYFQNPVVNIYDFPEGYTLPIDIQEATTVPAGLPVKYYSNNFNVGVDERENKLLVRRAGNYQIQGIFEGNYMYDPCSAYYLLHVYEESDPSITKEEVTIWFTELNVELIKVSSNTYHLQLPNNDKNLDLTYSSFNWSVECDDPTNPCAIAGEYLYAENIGTFRITATLPESTYYYGATARYNITVYEENIEKEDIDLAFFDYEVHESVTNDGIYELQQVYWKLTSEDETHWRPARNLDITYSITPNTAEIRSLPTDEWPVGTLYAPSEGRYTIRATFNGNSLYNPSWTEYILDIGQVVIEPEDPEISMPSIVYYDENWPSRMYDIPTISNPNDLPLTITYDPAMTVQLDNTHFWVHDPGQYTMTVSFAGNEDYYAWSQTCTIVIVAEQITKRDVTISFAQDTIDWNYDETYNIERSPQTPTLSESMPLVWTVTTNLDVSIRSTEDIYEEGVLVETTNPKIWYDAYNQFGTITVTATFVGDRYRNPASASYTLNVSQTLSNVYFTNDIVSMVWDETREIWPVQLVNHPNDITITYKVEWMSGFTEVDPNIGIRTIGSAGDWEVRAYWTEYGTEHYVSYILRLTEAEYGLTFDRQEVTYYVNEGHTYALQIPIITGDIEIDEIYYTINGFNYNIAQNQRYLYVDYIGQILITYVWRKTGTNVTRTSGYVIVINNSTGIPWYYAKYYHDAQNVPTYLHNDVNYWSYNISEFVYSSQELNIDVQPDKTNAITLLHQNPTQSFNYHRYYFENQRENVNGSWQNKDYNYFSATINYNNQQFVTEYFRVKIPTSVTLPMYLSNSKPFYIVPNRNTTIYFLSCLHFLKPSFTQWNEGRENLEHVTILGDDYLKISVNAYEPLYLVHFVNSAFTWSNHMDSRAAHVLVNSNVDVRFVIGGYLTALTPSVIKNDDSENISNSTAHSRFAIDWMSRETTYYDTYNNAYKNPIILSAEHLRMTYKQGYNYYGSNNDGTWTPYENLIGCCKNMFKGQSIMKYGPKFYNFLNGNYYWVWNQDQTNKIVIFDERSFEGMFNGCLALREYDPIYTKAMNRELP